VLFVLCGNSQKREMSAMNLYRIFFGILVSFIIFTSAAAYDLKQGMHGMSWASSISDYAHLEKVRESYGVTYYVNADMIYQVVNQSVTGVFYGFYKDQFFAVYIKLRRPDQFDHLKQLFSKNYGEPKAERNASDDQVVYRWKVNDVKIKLKMKESIGDIKLAVYYIPIASRLNEAQLEQITPDDFKVPHSKKDETRKSAPLLDF
jgi:hypothetical protein